MQIRHVQDDGNKVIVHGETGVASKQFRTDLTRWP